MTDEQFELAKRRAWAEYHFRQHGLTDKEVMDFRPLPSENFTEGFEAGMAYDSSCQWISVEDALPKDGSMVTAHSPNGRLDVLKYHDNEFIDELHQAHCVDFWMQIPALPQTKKANEKRL